MRILDIRKVARPLAGDMHVHYYNRVLQPSLGPARESSGDHDSYALGLHHLCFRVADEAEVDGVADELAALGIAEPRRASIPLVTRSVQ